MSGVSLHPVTYSTANENQSISREHLRPSTFTIVHYLTSFFGMQKMFIYILYIYHVRNECFFNSLLKPFSAQTRCSIHADHMICVVQCSIAKLEHTYLVRMAILKCRSLCVHGNCNIVFSCLHSGRL